MIGYFLGVDIGTSGVKAAAFDPTGRQLALAYQEYPLLCAEPDMAELDPEAVFQAFIRVIKDCTENVRAEARTPNNLEAIGISTQLFSIMGVDAHGCPLTNVFTWADSRAANCSENIENHGRDARATLYNATGCRVHPMYPLSKIAWLRATRPELHGQIAKYISIKEYIIFKLFGRFVIDIADASTTGFFNIHKFEWDAEILREILNIGPERLGECVDPTFTLSGMRREYANAMRIDESTPVAIGAGDGMLANAGCGVFDATRMSCTIGTSGALRIAAPRPLLDPAQRTWCYCFTRDIWLAGGAINNGGIVLKWLRDSRREHYEREAAAAGLAGAYELFNRDAAQVPPGSDGLLFLPLLTGERSPNWNASATGTLHGIKLIHGPRHIVRAAMEGVILRMYSVYEALAQFSSDVNQIRANGGYVNSAVWLQMQADIFQREIAVAGVGEAAAFGAAYMAMAATGAIPDLKTPLPAMDPQKIIRPNTHNAEIYRGVYGRFKELYERLWKSAE